MRKIESQMCAVQSNKDWQSGNTSVHFDPETGISVVRLHGNKIAEVTDNDMTIFDGGWQSVTTKITTQCTLCDYFVSMVKVFSRKTFKWFVRKFVGESSVTGKVYNVDDFTNGYMSLHDVIIEGLGTLSLL